MLRPSISFALLISLFHSCNHNSKTVFKPNSDYGLDTFISKKDSLVNFSKSLDLRLKAVAKGLDSKAVDVCRILLKIRCNSIPIGSKIDSSFLYLKISNNSKTKENTFLVAHKINENWDDQQVNWNNCPDFSKDIEFKIQISGKPRDYYRMDMTNYVRDLVDKRLVNNGLLIKLEDETINNFIHFYSSNARENDNWPKLVVYYQ